MNIFMVDSDPHDCAAAHVDSHIRKMIIEYAQLLSGAHHYHNSSFAGRLYKPTHMNTRYPKWARENSANYLWLRDLWIAVQDEYAFRFGSYHKSMGLTNFLRMPPRKMDRSRNISHLPYPDKLDQAWIVDGNPVATYRNIYRFGKSHLHAWTNRPQPDWLQGELQC